MSNQRTDRGSDGDKGARTSPTESQSPFPTGWTQSCPIPHSHLPPNTPSSLGGTEDNGFVFIHYNPHGENEKELWKSAPVGFSRGNVQTGNVTGESNRQDSRSRAMSPNQREESKGMSSTVSPSEQYIVVQTNSSNEYPPFTPGFLNGRSDSSAGAGFDSGDGFLEVPRTPQISGSPQILTADIPPISRKTPRPGVNGS